jgi:flagellar hook-basal body complex protein FliE
MQAGMPIADLVKTASVEAANGPQNARPSGSSQPFGSLLRDAIGSVQNLEAQASQATEGLLRGDGVDIHTAMIATQKADLAFEMALSVRNKAVAAYQQIMNMQF